MVALTSSFNTVFRVIEVGAVRMDSAYPSKDAGELIAYTHRVDFGEGQWRLI
jgi:hypothetical protein